MKVRHGFVSNSSSSSFVVIAPDDIYFPEFEDNKLILSYSFLLGNSEFGWEEETYWGFFSKFNWAYLQTSGNEAYLLMLKTVVEDNTKCVVEYDLEFEDVPGYIDHQSVGGENLVIFESEDNLKNFLFSQSSYIQTGNDNV